jgi:hypothetical protein
MVAHKFSFKGFMTTVFELQAYELLRRGAYTAEDSEKIKQGLPFDRRVLRPAGTGAFL